MRWQLAAGCALVYTSAMTFGFLDWRQLWRRNSTYESADPGSDDRKADDVYGLGLDESVHRRSHNDFRPGKT
jgi:hypothetical protein